MECEYWTYISQVARPQINAYADTQNKSLQQLKHLAATEPYMSQPIRVNKDLFRRPGKTHLVNKGSSHPVSHDSATVPRSLKPANLNGTSSFILI